MSKATTKGQTLSAYLIENLPANNGILNAQKTPPFKPCKNVQGETYLPFEDVAEILRNTKGLCGYACQHDKDVSEKTGELKKAHTHIILMFEEKTSYSQVLGMFMPGFFANDYLERVKNLVGAMRYLIHIDNKEKAQYLPSEVIAFGNAKPYAKVIAESSKDKAPFEILAHLALYSRISTFAELTAFIKEFYPAWFRSFQLLTPGQIQSLNLILGTKHKSDYLHRIHDGEFEPFMSPEENAEFLELCAEYEE